MTYRIIEQLCLGKHADASLCEDVIHASPHFIAIIDGATSKTAAVINGMSGGRAIAKGIDAALGMTSPDINYEDMFKHINRHIRDVILSPNPEIMRGGSDQRLTRLFFQFTEMNYGLRVIVRHWMVKTIIAFLKSLMRLTLPIARLFCGMRFYLVNHAKNYWPMMSGGNRLYQCY